MSFVGAGVGSYSAETTYKYVGLGAGEFDVIRPKFGLMGCGVVIFVAVLAAIIALIMLWPDSPTTTTPAPTGPPSTCLIWGDPHLDTFDHAFPSFYEEGEFWLVRSKMVAIQGRYLATQFTNGLSATNAIAVGGPFLLGHTVVVGPLNGGQILFDGEPALTNFPSSAALAGVATLRYDGQGNLVDAAQGHLDMRVVHMDLPLGVQVEVFRWENHINVRITMAPRVGGQDGHCGNFNGLAEDDTSEQIKARIGMGIVDGECLFHHTSPVRPGPQHSLGECKREHPVKFALALRTCRASDALLDTDRAKRGCVFDVCFAGLQYAAQDAAISPSA